MIPRLFKITIAALSLLALFLRERRRRIPADSSALPARLRETLDELGATFVKIGQALSMRPDLLPEPYLSELQGLREHARPFPSEAAKAELKRALGREPAEVFRTFEDEPFAAASIAQVHRATLLDGQEVIVKIRRPLMPRRIDEDMRILVFLARLAQAAVPRLRPFQPERLARDIWANIRQETDLLREARNIRRFAEAYRHRTDIYVPEAFPALSSEAVLVQVFSHGTSIEDAHIRADGPRIANTLVDFYLDQLLRTGIFHGDPHPGNLFIMDDKRICFHDFGLISYLDRATRRNLGVFLQAFVRQDAGWMLDAAIQLSLIERGADRSVFVPGIEEILGDYAALPLKQWSIAEAFRRVMRLGDRAHVAVPHNLVILMRTLFLVEGCLRQLDPDFNVLDKLLAKGEAAIADSLGGGAKPPALARLGAELALTAQDLPALLAAWLHRSFQEGGEPALGVRLVHADEAERRRDRRAALIASALLALGVLVASALLAGADVGPVLFGMPMLSVIGFGGAVWLCWRLMRNLR